MIFMLQSRMFVDGDACAFLREKKDSEISRARRALSRCVERALRNRRRFRCAFRARKARPIRSRELDLRICSAPEICISTRAAHSAS